MDNLQEAYLSVYEATAMAKRGLNEPAIRKQIASNTKGGEAADRATALENQPTYGNKNKEAQRSRYARAQRGDFRRTTSSSPGLHGYAHKSDDPEVKAKQAARGAQRGVLTSAEKKQLNREEVDLFDYLLEYLVAEGYADTNDAAIAIMANMSEEWRESITEGAYEDRIAANNKKYDRNRQRAAQRAAARNAARREGRTGNVPGVGYVSPRPEGETYRDSSGVERHTSGARMPKKDS